MERSISYSSFRVPFYKPSSHGKYRLTPIKPTTKEIDVKSYSFPSKCTTKKSIFGESRFSKSVLYGQHKRYSVRACGQDESTGLDTVLSESQVEFLGSNPVLEKAKIESVDSDSPLAKILRFGSACYKFIRPYAMNQAIISAICLYARVFVESPHLFTRPHLYKAFTGLIAIIFAHAYCIGINSIYDVDIDRINKPYLPIPSGDISMKQAWFLVISTLFGGLLILRLMNADLITASLYCLGLLFGTSYSVPPFRFKRFSLATSTVLPLTCGVIHNVGILYATRASLGLPFLWSPPVVLITSFATLFFVVISTMKDLTDVEGDLKHHIWTFTAMIGPKKITFLCTGILLVNYMGAIAASIFMPQAIKSYILLPTHATFALWLLFQVRKLDNANYSKALCNFFNTFHVLLVNEELLWAWLQKS